MLLNTPIHNSVSGVKKQRKGGGLKVKGFVLQVQIESFTSINIMKKSYYLAKKINLINIMIYVRYSAFEIDLYK